MDRIETNTLLMKSKSAIFYWWLPYLGSIAAIIFTGIILYGYVLELPLAWDDTWRLKLAELPWKEVLRGWRPFQFTVFKLLFSLQGGIRPASIKALGLALHILNGILCYLWCLTLRLQRAKLVALSAALLFIAYPFSPEAVAWVTLSHLQTTLLILGALVLFQISRPRHSGWLWLRVGSLFCAALAPLGHPSGVVIAPMITILLALELTRTNKRVLLSSLPYWGCAAAGFFIQRSSNTGNWTVALFRDGITDIMVKLAYVLQGHAYPIIPLVNWISIRVAPFNQILVSCIFYILFLIIYFFIMYKMGILKYAIIMILFSLISISPSFVMKNSIYLLRSPRLFYESSFSIAIFLSLIFSKTSVRDKYYKLKAISLIAFFLLLFASGLPHLAKVKSMNLDIRQAIIRANNVIKSSKPKVLVVNFPGWLEANPRTQPIGVYEAKILSRVLRDDISELFRLNGTSGLQVTSRTAPALPFDTWVHHIFYMSPYTELDGLQPLLRENDQVYVTRVLDTITLREAGRLESTMTLAAQHNLARYEDIIALLDMRVEQLPDEWRLDLRWQCWRTPEKDVMVLLHIYDSNDNMVSLQDAYPLMGLSRPKDWQPGDIWHDIRYVRIPDNLPSGTYTVTTGLYYLGENARPAGFAQDGSRLHWDEVTVGTFTVP